MQHATKCRRKLSPRSLFSDTLMHYNQLYIPESENHKITTMTTVMIMTTKTMTTAMIATATTAISYNGENYSNDNR